MLGTCIQNNIQLILIYDRKFYITETYGVGNPRSIFSKFDLNIDQFSIFLKEQQF